MYFSKLKWYAVSLLKKYSLFKLIFVTSISDYIPSYYKYAGNGILKKRFNLKLNTDYYLFCICQSKTS